MTEQQHHRVVSEIQQFRADIYQLLAGLLRDAPSQDLLDFLGNLEVNSDDDGEMVKAWSSLKLAAQTYSVETVTQEYTDLFIGLGHGEVIPYASWYMTGTLMDTQLVQLRQDLVRLGFAREDAVKEPEDHIAALCEVMSVLLLENPQHVQLSFWQKHLKPWADRLWSDLANAQGAAFYAAVAHLAEQFFIQEKDEFAALTLETPVQEGTL
ncbi:chaperone TorD involved in molybdoenzyme TorA maturation [Ferrimonas sediminum]|uniref:Chaperone TorD involved in molybdoenzyme TorA maturation n=1 Tax=Ferrimonas sediminum TaxID=718193 RepID=A0A1G8JHM5_9GAMM|nr:molecular chaperone TorD family protein [Ferrimonas sediminum]SDI30591.1 chaperone TorD involved in molybdoenzyme TorA maturation [Ferrimonas sediminum]